MKKIQKDRLSFFDKNYNSMNRREKRAYKRWLNKNSLWDGAIVIENLEKERKLLVGNIFNH